MPTSTKRTSQAATERAYSNQGRKDYPRGADGNEAEAGFNTFAGRFSTDDDEGAASSFSRERDENTVREQNWHYDTKHEKSLGSDLPALPSRPNTR